MKKLIWIAALLLISALVLTACGGDKKPAETEGATVEESITSSESESATPADTDGESESVAESETAEETTPSEETSSPEESDTAEDTSAPAESETAQDTGTAESDPAESEPAETAPAETKPVETKPVETEIVETETVEPEPETEAPVLPENLTNVALGATVECPDSYIPPENFFHHEYLTDGSWTGIDEDIHLGWNSRTDSAYPQDCDFYITITLDQVYSIYQIVLKPMQWSKGEKTPQDFSLELSADGTSWTTVVTVTDMDTCAESDTSVVPVNYYLETPMDAMYFRMHITRHSNVVDQSGAYNSGIGELELFGCLPGTAIFPAEPVEPEYLITADTLYTNACFSDPDLITELSYKQLVEATMGDGYVSLHATGLDTYVTAIPMGTSDGPSGKFLAIKYRTSTAADTQGQVFIGSEMAWSGQGDTCDINYNSDGEWHVVIVDLSSVAKYTANAQYLRFDFFKDGTGKSLDVAYLAFFASAAEAEAYEAYLNA